MQAVPVIARDAEVPTADDELERYARRLLARRQWTPARAALHLVAMRAPGDDRLRALMAYAGGHEAAERDDIDRARSEWERALLLDPRLADARAALATLPGSLAWLRRWWRRAAR